MNAALSGAGLKDKLDGGFLYLFCGPVPDSATDALNTTTLHTQILKITESDDGSTGLTFDPASGGGLPKAPAEDWSGTAAFDGVGASETTLQPTFLRFCEAGDDGRGAATTQARFQATVGATGAEFTMPDINVEEAQTRTFAAFEIRLRNVLA
jgi:hypothetical protein